MDRILVVRRRISVEWSCGDHLDKADRGWKKTGTRLTTFLDLCKRGVRSNGGRAGV